MAVTIPSYVAKVRRAEKHLGDLKAAIAAYADIKPYAVAESIEGNQKRKIRTLTFTADPADTDIPLIAADAIYDLRSSLDHLMSAVVVRRDRGSAMFPIFFQGVWEAIVPGESSQRIKDRERWASCIKSLSDEARAVLKRLQPPDGGGEPDDANLLEVINRLSNTDRHTQLPVIAAGLSDAIVSWKLPDGTLQRGRATVNVGAFIENNARLSSIPYQAVDMQIEGTPLVAVRVKQERGEARRYFRLPDDLSRAAKFIGAVVIPELTPFLSAGS